MITVFSDVQTQDFRRDGFVVVRGLYSPEEVRRFSDWIDELASREPVAGRQMVYYEKNLKNQTEKKILSRIEKFTEFHEGLGAMARAPRMMDRVEALLEAPSVLFKEKINFKLPGGGGFEPHQDIQPGWDDYAPYFLSVLVTIDESTIENGCLELSAGHHTRGLIGEKWKPLTVDQLAGVEFRHYPMAPGDVAFFDCFVPHQSKPNLTNRPRRNLYLTYNRLADGDHREKYFADKRKSYPPDYEREPGKEYIFRV